MNAKQGAQHYAGGEYVGIILGLIAIADAIEGKQPTRHTIVESVERERLGADRSNLVVTTKRPDGRVERFYCTHSEIVESA
jgi:hypothetical protein